MPKTAFLFSGQGAQTTGMMKDLYLACPAARNVFETADRCLGRGISFLCFEGAQEELNLTHNTQPCVLAAELAAYAAVTEKGARADAVAGFSLGEYGALVAAQAIDLEDAFKIIQIRADAMQEAVPVGKGGMAAILKLSKDEVEALCKEAGGYVIPVNFNCPGQIVVSGEMEAVDRLVALASGRKLRVMKLPVSAPFHCSMMEPAARKLEEAFRSVTFRTPAIPCYSNVDARPYKDARCIADQLCVQAKSPVLWEQTIRQLHADGVTTFIELGPGNTLSKFVKKTLEDVRIFNVNSVETLNETVKNLY